MREQQLFLVKTAATATRVATTDTTIATLDESSTSSDSALAATYAADTKIKSTIYS
jgi:hypothetical protein